MSEDPSPKRGEFQMSWQVAVILALTMVAMALPLFGVALFAKGFFAAKSPETGSASVVAPPTQALASALERTADATLGANATALLGLEIRLTIPADQIPARAARIAELGRSAGGNVLEIPGGEGSPAGTARLIVHVPKSRVDLLRRAIAGEPVDFAAIPPSSEGEILQVTLGAP